MTELYLCNNQLTRIPESIGNLTNLTRLSLNDNQLTNLPEGIENLSKLTELYLEGNPLVDLPVLQKLGGLEKVSLPS